MACLLGFAVEPLLFRLASPPSAAAQRRVVALALAGVAAWVGAGAAYFSLARGLAWPVALEFCASAVTTTGMVGLPAPGNRLGDGAALSLAAYSLVGVCAYMLLIREGARLASMHSGARITVAICAPGSA